MQYDEFISKVAERTGVEREQAEAVTRATLATLAARITHGEAEDLAAQLPDGLKGPLRTGPAEAEPFDLAEFKRRVAQHAGIPQDEAERAIAAVFATLSEAVTGGEFDDVLSQLPKEYRELVGAAKARAR
jgi:uncharacterized protein (DUF2267 family)